VSDLRSQTFVGFSNDLIDHGFHVLGAFPDHKLAIGTCTFANGDGGSFWSGAPLGRLHLSKERLRSNSSVASKNPTESQCIPSLSVVFPDDA
jgi:hypothetical protein